MSKPTIDDFVHLHNEAMSLTLAIEALLRSHPIELGQISAAVSQLDSTTEALERMYEQFPAETKTVLADQFRDLLRNTAWTATTVERELWQHVNRQNVEDIKRRLAAMEP